MIILQIEYAHNASIRVLSCLLKFAVDSIYQRLTRTLAATWDRVVGDEVSRGVAVE